MSQHHNHNIWISLKIPDDHRDHIQKLNESIKKIYDNDYDMMDYNVYHMTLCFLGDKFHNIPHLQELLNSYENLEFNLQFDKIALFPPDKENLIIIKYKPNKQLDTFVKKLKDDIYKNFGIKETFSDFVPHITIGKLKKTKYNQNEIHQKMSKIEIDDINLNFETDAIEINPRNLKN